MCACNIVYAARLLQCGEFFDDQTQNEFCILCGRTASNGKANKQKIERTDIVCARKSIFSQVIGYTHLATQNIKIFL